MVREDLNPVEEAKACAALVEELGLTKEELARRVGRSRPAVSNLIRLLELPDETLELLEGGSLSEGHGRALLGAQRQRRPPPPRPRRRAGRLVGARDREQGSAGWPAKGKPRQPPIDPEQAAALEAAGDALEAALGHEVSVRAAGDGFAVEIRFDDVAEAHALARALRRRAG